MQPDTLVRRLSALAQTTRLSLFRRLLKQGQGGARAQDLACQLGIGGTALSFHLKALLRSGLIEGRAEAGDVRYFAVVAATRELIEALSEDCCEASDEGCELGDPPRPEPGRRLKSPPRQKPSRNLHAPA